MSRFSSRHMLPLSSRLFSNSTSRLNLRSERRAHEDFVFSDDSQRRPGTSHSVISPFSRTDLNATALPEYTLPDVPPIPEQFGGPAPVQTNPPSMERLIESPPCPPENIAKSGKGAVWRRFKVRLKNAFISKRQNSRTPTSTEEEVVPMQIGSPYGFEHRLTYGALPLMTTASLAIAAGSRGESSAVQADEIGERNGNSSAEQVASSSDQAGNGGEGVSAGYGRLGRLNSEGIAVEASSDADWEDVDEIKV